MDRDDLFNLGSVILIFGTMLLSKFFTILMCIFGFVLMILALVRRK